MTLRVQSVTRVICVKFKTNPNQNTTSHLASCISVVVDDVAMLSSKCRVETLRVELQQSQTHSPQTIGSFWIGNAARAPRFVLLYVPTTQHRINSNLILHQPEFKALESKCAVTCRTFPSAAPTSGRQRSRSAWQLHARCPSKTPSSPTP